MELVLFFLSLLGSTVTALNIPLSKSPHRTGVWQKIGDMILSPRQIQFLYTPFKVVGKNVEISETSRWKTHTIPYEIIDDFTNSEKKKIETVLKKEFEKTCIQFRPREETDKDYIRVENGAGCWSFVGRIGGQQTLNLNRQGCLQKRTIAHEFLHAIGLYHQHVSSNRDDYVTIKWDNIHPNYRSNFRKYQSDRITDFGQPYDFASIMHYAKDTFSVNGKPTIIAKDPKQRFGAAESLSAIDIIKVNKMYDC